MFKIIVKANTCYKRYYRPNINGYLEF